MGLEARCRLRLDGGSYEGTALLETDELLFRGGTRLRIPLSSVRSAAAASGELAVEHAGGTAILELGAVADRWAERIRSPKSLLDKLGVTAGQRIAVLGLDGAFADELRARGATVTVGRLTPQRDLVFLGAEDERALARLPAAVRAIVADGAVWVVHPKGRDGLKDTVVFDAARRAGLTYTKVARFSETHTAEKLVIPRARR